MRSMPAAVGIIGGLFLASPVKQIDHVMFTGGPELSGLIRVLRDSLELPVVFDGLSQTPPSGGTCFSFGNVCLEVMPLPQPADNAPRRPQLGSLALEAHDFAATEAALNALQIDHFPPARQASSATIGVRGLGGMFFIEYEGGMRGRRQRFQRELDASGGGALGIIRMTELSQVRANFDDQRAAWIRLFGEPAREDGELWRVGDGPAIRVVAAANERANTVIVQVRSSVRAAEALRRLMLPFSESGDELRIDPDSLLGLRIILREAKPNSPRELHDHVVERYLVAPRH